MQEKCALHFLHLNQSAKSDADLENPVVLEAFERLKSYFRNIIQGLINAAERERMMQEKVDHAKLLQKLRDLDKPHEMGTVAEIAAKYGISKSEVRRRKADGTLHELKKASI